MKKYVHIWICILLCISLSSCAKPIQKNELRIASETLDGDFIGGFSTSDYDSNIRDMIHGYSSYEYDETGAIILNEVPIAKVERSAIGESGNVIYDYTLVDDLKWSDGHNLTASDYVFAILFESSKEWMDAGALNADYDHILGYMEYSSASADETYFSGVQLIDDTHFRVILDGAMLPYYNEIILASVTPRPLHIFTSGKGSILSDEFGSRLQDIPMQDVAQYAKDEYRSHPNVTCGPYMFESYHNKILKLQKNLYFKGDFREQIPTIETIIIKEMDTALHVDALINQEVDLITNVIEEDDIQKAKLQSNLNMKSYESSAYGNLAFACDFGPTSDVFVRRAISYALDKNEIIQTALGGMAIPIASDYVPAQWMAKEVKDKLDTLNSYSYHMEKAKEELNKSAYIYERDGITLFNEDKIQEDGSYLRYNEFQEPLIIHHLGSEGNAITDAIQLQMSVTAPMLGMDFIIDYGDFSSIMQNYYEGSMMDEQRYYHSFNLASVLPPGYDPYYNYHGQFMGTSLNPSGIDDKELNEILDTMVRSGINNKDEYLDIWFAYEERYNEILPTIPLYISQEHTVYADYVDHVEVNTMENYGHVISGIRFK